MKKIDQGVYGLSNKKAAIVTSNSKFKTTNVTKNMNHERFMNICQWGDDNLLPQNLLKQFKKTDAAIAGFEVLKTAHFGNKFKLFQEIETETGVELRQRSINSFPEILDFFKATKWDKTISAIIHDFEMWWLSIPEFLVSPDQNKIISVKRHQTPWCRFSLPNEKTGFIEEVIINSDWENYDEKFNHKIPVLPDMASADEIKEYIKKKKIFNFVIPVMNIKDNEKIYPVVSWHSAFFNGWVETVLSVPEFKKFMFQNQLHFKYVVYISDEFMVRKFGAEDWQEFSPEEKEKHREDLVNKIDEHMSGNEASGRSLISPYFTDANGNLMKGIEIHAVDDKIKDGNFLPDAAAGNSQILFAMGVDPSIVGAGIPGGKNLSGSGSDKREAYTILGTRQPMKRIHTLEVFNFIRDFNGWDPTLEGNFPNQILTTLDKETSGRTEVVN